MMDRRYFVKYYEDPEDDTWTNITCRSREEAEQVKEDLELEGYERITIEEWNGGAIKLINENNNERR